MRIIALCGPKTCGKDTMAQGLLKQNSQVPGKYIPLFKRTPFAEGPKTICHQVFGWSYEDMEKPEFKETVLDVWPYCEPRWPVMDIANWMRDKYGPDVWVNVLNNRLAEIERTERHGAYVITDLRFPNELTWLKEMGALVIYVNREEAEQALEEAKAAGDPKALNPSEAHYEMLRVSADYVLDNNGSPYQGQHKLMDFVSAKFDHWVYWGMGPFAKPSEGAIDVVA
jgi:hypothetical protein